MSSGFSVVSPGGASTPSRTWTVWTYENNAFKKNIYSASLSSTLTAAPDSYCPTAFLSSDGKYTMKSGYGISETVKTTVTTNSPSDVTPCQNVLGMYPEYQYNSYWRLFESFAAGKFQLAQNKYSMYNSRTHFTPVWRENGADYIPEVYCFDAWTPAGMLTCYATYTLHINGSCFDDWYVYPMK